MLRHDPTEGRDEPAYYSQHAISADIHGHPAQMPKPIEKTYLKRPGKTNPMKRLALVAGHFPPSNLASVHRARLWAQHLEEFGWRPTIITTHWRYYEESLDWELCELIDPRLEVLRTRALSTKPLRVVGDIGLRAFPWHLSTLRRVLHAGVDLVHITVPSFYSAMLGDVLSRNRPIPFGIDYIDPWVHSWPEAEHPLTKAWTTLKLANVLEPRAVRQASLITGITEGYYAGMLERNPRVAEKAVIAAMPYGNSAHDFSLIARRRRKLHLFDPGDGNFHFVYAGAMLPRAYRVLECFFAALMEMRISYPHLFSRVRVHFVGTGKSPDDPLGHNILPHTRQFGLEGTVTEHPVRVPYVDILAHLVQASAILVLGSTEPHYSPSKIYQCVEARRPIFALLHQESSALRVLTESSAGVGIPLNETTLPDARNLAARLASFINETCYDAKKVQWSKFEAYSARESTRTLAIALDAALERFNKRHPNKNIS